MPFEIITVRETLVTAFGFTIVDVDLDFVFDPDTCSFQFARSTLNRDGIKFLGTGSNYFLSVVQLGTTQVEECESPPNTCRKVITLGIQLRRSFNSTILGTASAKKLIVGFARGYQTECLQACCA